MNTVLWILQALLAIAMLASGAMKLSKTKEQLHAAGMPWVEDFSAGQVKGIGTLEVLAAIGLILPGLLDIAPVLVAVAAVGVALTMAAAAVMHLRRGEGKSVPVNIVLLAIAVFVAVERFGPHSF